MIYDIRQGLIYEIIKPFEGYAIETDHESESKELRHKKGHSNAIHNIHTVRLRCPIAYKFRHRRDYAPCKSHDTTMVAGAFAEQNCSIVRTPCDLDRRRQVYFLINVFCK